MNQTNSITSSSSNDLKNNQRIVVALLFIIFGLFRMMFHASAMKTIKTTLMSARSIQVMLNEVYLLEMHS